MASNLNILTCKKGCCTLKTLYKTKHGRDGIFHPFEKRKAGVFVYYENKILLSQSYNSCWGIPKGQMELTDAGTKECAVRELEEETGLRITLQDSDLYRIILDNCYIYRYNAENMDIINQDNLIHLDSTGIGWVDFECAFDFEINYLTKKLLLGTYTTIQ